ncbi:helix-turn-helix transcriptional regulator [Aquimarina sp. U1-2]|uniref:response regulator transcription factor n=1 Tax=Aquimarina sp. U1-2 TaxID=2823141 RepID=UPI001AECF3A5|nr:helix-turn-helix transcriptional regulator [Aquimarina sp. U1-2]MBP2831878.1 helix-turn-helix transcriptional regulator [Aquimarina sp. U1-2]
MEVEVEEIYPLTLIIAVIIIAVLVIVALTIWYKIELNKAKSLHQDTTKPTGLLSDREKEVLEQILQKKSQKEIADELNIEISTVKSHVNKIYKSYDVKNKKELVDFVSKK